MGSAAQIMRVLPEFSWDSKDPEMRLIEAAQYEKASGLEQAVAAAFERGFAEGRAVAAATTEAAVADCQTAAEVGLREARAVWTSHEADVFATALDAGLQRIETSIASVLHAALAPLLDAPLQRRLLDDIASKVLKSRVGHSAVAVVISGTQDVCEAIAVRLARHGISAQCDPREQTSVTVKIEETEIIADLAEWRLRVTEALT